MDGKGRLITFLYLRFVMVCEGFSHAPIVEVLRPLQDDSGRQMRTFVVDLIAFWSLLKPLEALDLIELLKLDSNVVVRPPDMHFLLVS